MLLNVIFSVNQIKYTFIASFRRNRSSPLVIHFRPAGHKGTLCFLLCACSEICAISVWGCYLLCTTGKKMNQWTATASLPREIIEEKNRKLSTILGNHRMLSSIIRNHQSQSSENFGNCLKLSGNHRNHLNSSKITRNNQESSSNTGQCWQASGLVPGRLCVHLLLH